MNPQDQVKLGNTKFASSCRGVSFEPKPATGTSPFSLDVAAAARPPPSQPPPDAPSGGQWVWLPATYFSRGSSRIFPSTGNALARSLSRPSSHFCDLEDEEEVDREPTIDEEAPAVFEEAAAVVPIDEAPLNKKPPPRPAPSAGHSRLGVILLDQGLFTVYKRLFVLCVALNAAGIALAATGRFPYAKTHAALFAMGNILALTLARSEALLRVVFWLVVKLFGRPWVPLLVKTGITAILQSLGGIHSGCGVSSLAWLAYALHMAVRQHRFVIPSEVVGVASATLGLLALSCLAAFPLVRHLHHNVFERTHRFAGWSALALLWVFVVLSVGYDPVTRSYDIDGAELVRRQELWMAAAITFFTFLPWITVRRVPVTVTARSTHASIITFQGGIKAGLLGRISRSPLSEWHAFGIISDGGESHAMLAGAVGDFTRGLISDPPTKLWVRGVHFAGLPYLLDLYRSATMVATGSGICVFLSFLMQPGPAELSLVWVAKGIEANFGEEIKAAVSNSEKLRGRIVVHDTATMGRPNVGELAIQTARRFGSEVVVVTSNPEGSRDVVQGCRKAGIPAFGPIWDS